ncbi:MAG: hypothetical protein L0H70_08405, partial [Xanthomonadales bacterium]|nr:hypothetical protein [Xanthomonadales bacterium]
MQANLDPACVASLDAPVQSNEPRTTDVKTSATTTPSFALTPPHSAASMRVTKRNGRSEAVDVNKIVAAVARCSDGLH